VGNPIGVNTWVWSSPFTTKETRLFGKIKKMGFDVVELPIEDPKLVNAKKIREALQRHELQATVCGAFGPNRDLTSDQTKYQKEGIKYIKWCVDFCAEIGCPTFAGPMYSAVGKARGIPAAQRKKEWNLAVKNLRPVAKYAGDKGVVLAIEPLNRFETDLVNLVSQAVKLCKDIGHPAAQIHLDSFHMNIEEKDVVAACKLAGKRIAHVHASESDRGTPGTGQCDWKGLAKGLKAAGYKGPVVIETFTPAVKSIAKAAAIWRKLAPSQDGLAREGCAFLKKLLK